VTQSEQDDRIRARIETAADTMPETPIRWRRVTKLARRKALLSVLAASTVGAVVAVLLFLGGSVGRLTLHRYEASLIPIPFAGVTVPDVVHEHVANAQATLKHVGLKSVVADNCTPYQDCVITSTLPAAGSNVLSGSVVKLHLIFGNVAECSALPSIQTTPATQVVAALTEASFKVGAGPVRAHCAPLSIQWQVSDDKGAQWSDVSGRNILGATSARLQIKPPRTSESGFEYRAVLTDGRGSTDSAGALLTVNTPSCSARPVIKGPESREVEEGKVAMFTVVVSTPASCKAPMVQWYVEAPGGTAFKKIPKAISTSYTTPTTTSAQNETRYEATLKGTDGVTTTTEAAVLTVKSPCSRPPVITHSPESQTVEEGKEVTFTVVVSTPANCKAPTVQWYVEAPGGMSYMKIPHATSMSYSLESTAAQQSETKYEAVVTGSEGQETTSASATLKLFEADDGGA
jgi:beta-lactam-binding protein with PASTA domain